jgi:hypothetical protein
MEDSDGFEPFVSHARHIQICAHVAVDVQHEVAN